MGQISSSTGLVKCKLILSLFCCVCSFIFLTTTVRAEESSFRGRPVFEVLDEFRDGGLALVYSTNLVSDALTVVREPANREPVQLVIEILEPHGLTLNEIDGIYLVVRQVEAPEAEDTGLFAGDHQQHRYPVDTWHGCDQRQSGITRC